MEGVRKTKKEEVERITQLPIIYNCLSTCNMIIYNMEKVKKFSKKSIKEYEGTENFKIIECPKCNSEEIIKWGKYTRNVVYYKNGRKEEKTIEIKRIKCNKCNKTQSIIPSFLIPYKVHITEYITEVIKEKIASNKTNREIENKYKISRQLMKYWEQSFEEHYTRITITLKERNKKKVIKEIKKTIYEFILKYYQENKLIYMMYISREPKRPILKWAPT